MQNELTRAKTIHKMLVVFEHAVVCVVCSPNMKLKPRERKKKTLDLLPSENIKKYFPIKSGQDIDNSIRASEQNFPDLSKRNAYLKDVQERIANGKEIV